MFLASVKYIYFSCEENIFRIMIFSFSHTQLEKNGFLRCEGCIPPMCSIYLNEAIETIHSGNKPT